MTNKQNVEAIVEKLLTYLKEAPIEAASRKDLVQKISSLGERFAPNQNWYVKNMNRLFEIGGSEITTDQANKFLASLSEFERSDEAEKFRSSVLKIYCKILKKSSNIPDALMQIIAWILGEYGGHPQQSDHSKTQNYLSLICQVAHGTFEQERTRAAILLAITKLHANLGFIANEKVEQIMNDYKFSKVIEVQQRALDYWVLRKGGISQTLLFNTP